jgi:hypothetical protein
VKFSGENKETLLPGDHDIVQQAGGFSSFESKTISNSLNVLK